VIAAGGLHWQDYRLEEAMSDNQTEFVLRKGDFILCRADKNQEEWLLIPRLAGSIAYLEVNRPVGWHFEEQMNQRMLRWYGALSSALASLKEIGLEENLLDIQRERGFWSKPKKVKKDSSAQLEIAELED
jgi:hypothetical protein